MVKLYLCYQDDGGFVLQSKHRLLLDMQFRCQRAIVSNIRENCSLAPNNVNARAKLPFFTSWATTRARVGSIGKWGFATTARQHCA